MLQPSPLPVGAFLLSVVASNASHTETFSVRPIGLSITR